VSPEWLQRIADRWVLNVMRRIEAAEPNDVEPDDEPDPVEVAAFRRSFFDFIANHAGQRWVDGEFNAITALPVAGEK
jgi:hypothetical protein